MNLRKLAEGQPCYGRLVNVCNHDPSTVTLAHIRRGNIAGIGQKPCDIAALPLCSCCHAAFDGRLQTQFARTEIDADILRGLAQWLDYLDRNEIVVAA